MVLFDLLGCYLSYLGDGCVDAIRILAAGLGHAGTSAAASSYEACDGFDQVACVCALLLGSVGSCCHEAYLAVNGAGQYDYAFAQLFLELVAQFTEAVHVYAFQLGCQDLYAVDVFYLVHDIAQGVLGRLALQSSRFHYAAL